MKSVENSRQANLRACAAHFVLVIALAAYIIVAHASNLLPPEAILSRWKYCLTILLVTVVVWFLAKLRIGGDAFQRSLLALIVITDVITISLLIYADRGMASPAVALYAIAIATAALSYNAAAVLATALFSVAAYSYASIKYFVDFFNEGYKVQLYGTLGLYGAGFIVLAMIIISLIRGRRSSG